jgi:hypothetical protein
MGPGAANGIKDLLLALIPLGIGVAFLVAFCGLAAWAVGDAQKRGRSGGMIILLFLLCGPLCPLIWLIVRPRTTLVDRPPQEYTNADDALAAASKLDMLGDWDEAIALYQSAASRWPEHALYVIECINSINRKRGGR